MANLASVKSFFSDNDTFLWTVTFVGVCVSVWVGKADPKMLEYMMMAVVGRASIGKKEK